MSDHERLAAHATYIFSNVILWTLTFADVYAMHGPIPALLPAWRCLDDWTESAGPDPALR